MKCLIDNQLPPALARFLTARGIESFHVTEVSLAAAHDRKVWNYVLEHGYVLETKDDDFLNISSQSAGGQLVWVRVGSAAPPSFSRRLIAYGAPWKPA